ncbi:hypothetical protein [Leptospira kanakyensis]|uniref:hypothetical protein n=1 Tax=Leptospira kanakyensis TaxID=2484968 RepID=UPI00223D5218|nr:hypothetical protein [Leptospira kanakyensis]MCW7471820.1 hypothetical protein [Leptospira kanakyensis]MCW7482570.1 hypothetical protein [Leptospira kanakyensis]
MKKNLLRNSLQTISLIIISVFVSNCASFSYNFEKPQLEKNTLPTKPTFLLLFGTDKSITFDETSTYNTLPTKENKIIPVIIYETQHQNINESDYKTTFSLMTFCLIPCIYTSKFQMRVDFYTYRIDLDRVLLQDKISSEMIKYSITQHGYFGQMQNILSIQSINQKIKFRSIEPKSDFTLKIRPFISYINSRTIDLETQLENKTENKTDKKPETEVEINLKKIPATSCKDIYTFYQKMINEDSELLYPVIEKLNECISNKRKKYITKKHPFLKDFLDDEIHITHDKTQYFLHDLFNHEFVAKMRKNGYKTKLNVKKISDTKFSINLDTKEINVNVLAEFEKFDGTLFCTSFRSTSEEFESEGWEDSAKGFFLLQRENPSEDSKVWIWDWDLINKY